MKTVKVAAAVIRDGARVFTTQRGYGDYKDFWEFPGGKVEPGETPREALRREIREELDTVVELGEHLAAIEYDYPAFHLSMDCFWAEVVSGSLILKEHESARWLRAEELDSVDWLPADRTIIPLIRRTLTEAEDGGSADPAARNAAPSEPAGAIGERILVLGCCGSGKSTLARKLHERTGLPLVHLDLVWWKPDQTHISREEFDRRLDELTRGDRWIIEGDYSRTYERRIRACDTVVFLDYDEQTCIGGLKQRVGQKRPDIPWVEQRLEPELLELARRYPREQRPKLLALLEKYPDKRKLVFRTREQTEKWLSGIALPEKP